MKPSNALTIFAKKPAPGVVKTRLSPPLTQEEAAELYACMLRDTVAMAASLPGLHLSIHYQDDPGAAEYFAGIAPGVAAYPQRGGDLGERMLNAVARLLGQGFRQVAVIGSDSPDLPGDYILNGYDLLDGGADAVFGPAEDGGYYLLAMGGLRKELFSGLPWSSGELLHASLERAGASGLRVSLLPGWRDLDTWEDLLAVLERGGIPAAPLTDSFLRGLDRMHRRGESTS